MVHKEFDLARQNPENSDPVRKLALDQAEGILLNAGVVWPVEQPITSRIEVTSSFEQVLRDYKERPHTPQLVGAFHAVFFKGIAERAGVDLVVNPFEESQRALSEHERNGDMVIYIPDEVAKDRALLMKLFPEYKNHYALKDGNPFKDDVILSGYGYTESSIDAPFTRTTEEQLETELKKRNRVGLNITGDFLAGQVSKAISGKYLDQERTWARLLSSSEDGRVVNADFYQDGRFRVGSRLSPAFQYDSLGGRSFEGVE